MTDLTNYRVTDGIDDVLAAQYNRVIDSIVRGELSNTESLAANKTLTSADYALQVFTPTAARDVTLPAVGSTNHPYYIINASATYALTVKNAGGSTIGTVPISSGGVFVSNGTAWYLSGLSQLSKASASDVATGTDDSKYVTALAIKNSVNVPNVAPGTSGYVLTSNGSAWTSAAAPAGGSNSICDGRLTLASGTPVTTTDQTGKTNVYYTPYVGNKIALYDGSSAWNIRTFTEITLALGTMTSGLPYDIFAYDNSGTVALEKLAWTNDTTRATALVYQDGVLVKSGATTRRYLGSFYTTATTTTEDSRSKRYLYNYYNRTRRDMYAYDTTDTWTYTTGAWRAANNNTTDGVGRVSLMVGYAEETLCASIIRSAYSTVGATQIGIGIGVDTTTAQSAQTFLAVTPAANIATPGQARYSGVLSAGFHYVQNIEYGATGVGFNGDNGGALQQEGLHADFVM